VDVYTSCFSPIKTDCVQALSRKRITTFGIGEQT